jgi:hypothetical protein
MQKMDRREFWGASEISKSSEYRDYNVQNLNFTTAEWVGVSKEVANLLQRRKVYRHRTLDGIVAVKEKCYSFHNISVFQKSKFRGTDTPTSVHLILLHSQQCAPKVVFCSLGYASHHNYFSIPWTDELLEDKKSIIVTIKKSGEQIKLFCFPKGSALREDLGTYVLGTKGSFNQKSPYIEKALQRLQVSTDFLDCFEVQTMFMEMMIGDEHVYPNPPGTPAFYVHGIRQTDGTMLNLYSTNVDIVTRLSPFDMDVVPFCGTFDSWTKVMKWFWKKIETNECRGEEGFYAHDRHSSLAIKLKLPEYLIRREMRESRAGPVLSLDYCLSYINVFYPDLQIGPNMFTLSDQQKHFYARWLQSWCNYYALMKQNDPAKAQKIQGTPAGGVHPPGGTAASAVHPPGGIPAGGVHASLGTQRSVYTPCGGTFVHELDNFEKEFRSESVPVPKEREVMMKVATQCPVTFLILLTGPPGSGKSSRISKILEPYSCHWITQDVYGTRKEVVKEVARFSEWVGEQKNNGLYMAVVDRCNPTRASRKLLIDEIRACTRSRQVAMWIQHVNVLPESLKTLTLRVMRREGHPTLGPQTGIISVAEIIWDHFLKVLEPAEDAIDIADSKFDILLKRLPDASAFRKCPVRPVSVNKRGAPVPIYAGILIFSQMPDPKPLLSSEKYEILQSWNKKTVLHCTLYYFGKNNFGRFLKSVEENPGQPLRGPTIGAVHRQIYNLCFSQELRNVEGKILGFYMSENLGVAGYLVQFLDFLKVGDCKVYHITTYLRAGAQAADSNKVVGDLKTQMTNSPKFAWFEEPVIITECYPGFATCAK